MPSFALEVEYAKSNRSACKQCKEKIEKDAMRIGLKVVAPEGGEVDPQLEAPKWHHFACLPRMRGVPWFKKNFGETAEESLQGLASLQPNDQSKVEALYKACRGEGPMPEAPAVVAPAPKEAVKGKRKKATEDGGEPTAKAAKPTFELSQTQLDQLDKARKELSGKNAAQLCALLAKNGLPKAGKKDELLERVAESLAWGVPPTCHLCEKVKLKFSRTAGTFSCPGFFDSEAGSFKRCKGPAGATAEQLARTPWQALSV